LICAQTLTGDVRAEAEHIGGYLKSSVDNAW
jgi:hypothetical protein